MVDKFEVGKWYHYVGDNKREYPFNGQPVKCTYVEEPLIKWWTLKFEGSEKKYATLLSEFEEYSLGKPEVWNCNCTVSEEVGHVGHEEHQVLHIDAKEDIHISPHIQVFYKGKIIKDVCKIYMDICSNNPYLTKGTKDLIEDYGSAGSAGGTHNPLLTPNQIKKLWMDPEFKHKEENKMDIKNFKKENLKIAKEKIEEERTNREIEVAMTNYRILIDRKDELERDTSFSDVSSF